ncbi:MAG TPA: GatB/YqeY domain-containing protein [Thermodesulfovibrionales bacterium]|nr:GatB/YqeY domain-containing protein [Thermodesulfovibrionales bacterium]
MSLLQRFDEDLRSAMKASQGLKVSVLRMAKAAAKNKEIEKGKSLTDEEIVLILSSMVKQRRESVEQYTKAGRRDLAAKETEEISILQSYMPRQLGREELDGMILDAIRESSAKDMRDIGKVMRILMPKIKGVADGTYVNERVKELMDRDRE